MKKLLELKNLVVSYHTYAGEVQSVRNVSFDIPEGKTVALVGESGCGKSVTAKSIMGLIQKPGIVHSNSKILFNGMDITKYTEKEWNAFRGEECSMIFQDALVSLNPTIRVGKQIAENVQNHIAGLSKNEVDKLVYEIIGKVEIPDAVMCSRKYPHELSGGMRQRIMIAMAMVTNPKLLIADEPTTALDVTIQAQILELMTRLQKENKMSILMITHDLGIVADIADEIVVMYAGKVVEKGTKEEIFYEPKHPYTWALLNSVPRLDLDENQELETIEGSIPDMTNPPSGCAFCNRCSHAMRVCEKYPPDETEVTSTHSVYCWLMDSRSDGNGNPLKEREEKDE